MTLLRKLGWIVGGFGFFCFVGGALFLYLFIFTGVFDEPQEMVRYTCTACLKADPSKCKTAGIDWWWEPTLKAEEVVGESVARDLCLEVVREKETCRLWVLREREQIFDIRCTSRVERRRVKSWNWPMH